MTKRSITNIAASIRQRLVNVAKDSNRQFSEILQYYALERWLFRLSQSKHRNRFVLKGALLLMVWKAPATRPTRDIDLLGRVNNDLEAIRAVVAEISQVAADDDGLVFISDSVTTERIVEDADYAGVRATFQAQLGNARIPMRIDIGFSDVMTPGPDAISYPTILGPPSPELFAYNRETTIAEKYEAMVKLGEINSRMKDFFDLALLAANFEFDGCGLARAIRATFERRGTELQGEPVCFSDRFATEPAKAAQWLAFVRRTRLVGATQDFTTVVRQVRDFLRPVALHLSVGAELDARWARGGPWS